MRRSAVLITILVAAIVGAGAVLGADRGPSFSLRGDNGVLVRGHVVSDPAPVDVPFRALAFTLLLEDNVLDQPITLLCGDRDADKCRSLDRGDHVLLKGHLRSSGDGHAVIVVDDVEVK